MLRAMTGVVSLCYVRLPARPCRSDGLRRSYAHGLAMLLAMTGVLVFVFREVARPAMPFGRALSQLCAGADYAPRDDGFFLFYNSYFLHGEGSGVVVYFEVVDAGGEVVDVYGGGGVGDGEVHCCAAEAVV